MHRRHRIGRVLVVRPWKRAALGDGADLFGVPLIDAAETAKFALHSVEIAVVVGVAGDEAIAADVVIGFHAFDHMHRKRQPGQPGGARQFVGHVEPGRGRVPDGSFGAQVVARAHQQVGFLAAHQVDVAHRARCARGQGGRPEQTGRAVAEQVQHRGRRYRFDSREMCEAAATPPGIAGLIEINIDRVTREIKDVRGAGPIDVGEAQAVAVEQVGVIEAGRLRHGDLGAEAAITKVGPVADRAVANAHEVGQAIPGHIGEKDRLAAISEHQLRSCFLIQ
ncbi:hypothetical protein D3C87_1262920 [compost metagenome]